jgi:hypothetical protein
MRREAAAEHIGIGATKFRTLARDPTTNCKGIWLTRCGMFKIGGIVIWIALLAMVMTSVIRSEKVNAAPHSVGQLHHAGKAQHQ